MNNSFSERAKRGVFAGVGILTCLLIATLGSEEPIRIGSRLELLLDRYLVDRLSGGAELRLHRPVPREVSLVRDEPWEGNASGYTTVFQDGSRYRMYYRGKQTTYTQGTITVPHREVICYAESRDGIQWLKPRLNLIEFDGSRANNIIWDDVGSHNFAPFKDDNPAAERESRYKAVGGKKRQGGLYAFQSPDGIHWSRMSEKPIITKGAFDSQNLAFWDRIRGEYRSYIRDFQDGRDIRTATSKDFLHWSPPEFLSYSPSRISELYTNQVIPYHRAPHLFLGFPTRYVDRGWGPSMEALPQLDYRRIRSSKSQREGTALTDGMFMSSRNGTTFQVWAESFIRPGLRAKDNWFYGDNYQNWGLVETRSEVEGAPHELSFYVTESSHQGESNRLRRFTLRIDGFVSLCAPAAGGELLTKPLIFQGEHLLINFSTSAAGSIRIEIQNQQGHPIPGFTLDQCPEIFGDSLERTVSWKGGADVSSLVGKSVRLRFQLSDADLYAFGFVEKPHR